MCSQSDQVETKKFFPKQGYPVVQSTLHQADNFVTATFNEDVVELVFAVQQPCLVFGNLRKI